MQDNLIIFPEPPPGDNVRLVTHTLPAPLTQLVGREHEVQALHALLLRPDVRLLTLTGTAGVGKTRLAFEVARNLVHNFVDGVHVVSLAPLSDPALVISTIAHSLGLTENGPQPLLKLLKLSQLCFIATTGSSTLSTSPINSVSQIMQRLCKRSSRPYEHNGQKQTVQNHGARLIEKRL